MTAATHGPASPDDFPSGLWSPVPEGIWSHRMTERAVSVVADSAEDIPADCCAPLVVSWLHRLWQWALRVSEGGRTSGLSDRRLAVEAWPESIEVRSLEAAGGLVRAALRAGGYMTGEGENERLHHFRRLHRRLLNDRERRRAERAAANAASTGVSTDVTADHSEDATALPEPDPDPDPDHTGERPGSDNGGGAGGGTGADVQENGSVRDVVPPEAEGLFASLSREQGGVGTTAAQRQAARLILKAEPNTRAPGPDRDGNDRTLYSGVHYLARLSGVDSELADLLRGHLGAEPLPGVLLSRAAPDLAEALVKEVGRRLPRVKKLEPYVRTALARKWIDLLADLAERKTESGRRRGRPAWVTP